MAGCDWCVFFSHLILFFPLVTEHSASAYTIAILSNEGDRGDEGVDMGAPASRSPEAVPSSADGLGATSTTKLGPLCTVDFKESASAAGVCKEIVHFVTPSCVGELFRSMPFKAMFRSIEANATKVRIVGCSFIPVRCLLTWDYVQTLMLSRTLERDVLCNFGEIQERVNSVPPVSRCSRNPPLCCG